MARKKTSKSKRIQDYLSSNPDARNREIVEALSAHSVTSADVSNAKSQLKKKQLGLTPTAAVSSSKRSKILSGRKSAGVKKSASSISLEELELTAGYVKSVGGVSRAQDLLQMVAQIQTL